MLSKYIYDANSIVFVYDVTNSASFESVNDWLAVVKKLTSRQEKVNWIPSSTRIYVVV